METTFLTDQQIWGDDRGNGPLQVMKSYGTKTGMSDLAIALGGYMGSDATSDNQPSGLVCSASSHVAAAVLHVCGDGDWGCWNPEVRIVGARPALPSSVTSSIKPSEVRLSRKISGVDVVEYGDYPQTIAPDDVTNELEQGFSSSQLKATGKKYTFDGEKRSAGDKPFKAKEYAEYEHRGKRYIRVEAPHVYSDSVLSNGKTLEEGDVCWIEVQPIEWLKDPSGVMVARQALFAGVKFDRNESYDGDFAKTDMKQYLDTFFAKEMQAGHDVATSAAVVGPNTAAVAARRDTQRQRALEDPSQGL